MKTIKNVFKYLFVAFVSLIIGLNIYSYSAKFLLHESLPMPFDRGVAIVMSGSMEPTLKVDDVVIVKRASEYKVDDIVIFEHNRSLVIHRIVEINGDEITTKGDFNNVSDYPINVNDIKGKLEYRIPRIGYLVYLIRKPIVSVALATLAIILFELSFNSYKYEKEKEKEELIKEIERLKKQND